jgi:1-acyl-sn-glycerol-3-phosphate acyltransferase
MDNFFMKRWVAFLTVLCVNGIPVDRHKVNRRSADQATRLLLAGWDLLIYPEGGRTTTGSLMEFKGGAAYLAEKVSGTVIPTFVHGAGNLQGPRYAKAEVFTQAPSRRRAPVSVTFGAPLRQAEGEHMRHFSARIEDAVAALGREVTGDVSYGRRD